MEYGIFLLCSTAALLGTLVGFGGGIFVVPAMVLGFGIPIEVAIGVTAMFPLDDQCSPDTFIKVFALQGQARTASGGAIKGS